MKTYRGFTFLTKVGNMKDFQRQFKVSDKVMKNNYAHGFVENNDYDVNVIRNILKKEINGNFLVRYVDKGNQYNDYFEIYKK